MKYRSNDNRKSAPQHTSTGSGSRPNGGKYKIPSSAPSDPKHLGRKGSPR